MADMVEVLVIFGLVGWLFLTFLESLSRLPFFPALVAAAILCPVLSSRDYLTLSRAWKLRGISSKRDPISRLNDFIGSHKNRDSGESLSFFSILSALAWCQRSDSPSLVRSQLWHRSSAG